MENEVISRDSTGEPFEVGLFRPEDAQGIVSLFRAVYGESYPKKVLCDPAFDAIQLYSDQAKKIGDMVRNDWLRTRKTLSRNQ